MIRQFLYCFNCRPLFYSITHFRRCHAKRLQRMNPQEREHLSSIVKQSNEVVMAHPSVPHMQAHYTIIPQPLAPGLPHPQCTAPHLVTPPLNLNEIVSTHVKSQCPECGKYLANVNEHMKLVHRKIR